MKKIFYSALIIFACIFASCQKNETLYENNDPTENAILVYMSADYSLSTVIDSNIADMATFLKNNPDSNTRIIIYRDEKYSTKPYLYEVYVTSSGSIAYATLETYSTQDSSDPDVMQVILDDFFDNIEAENYFLDIWSHGTGWEVSSSASRAVIEDNGNYMNISELKSVLPDNVFKCILFDACLMGNIETAYALKDKCNYMIASPAEVPLAGMPYDTLLEGFVTGDYAAAAEAYYDEYRNTTNYGDIGVIAVYNMAYIDGVKDAFKQVLTNTSVDYTTLDVSDIQQFSEYTGSLSSSYNYQLYDMLNYVEEIAESDDLSAFETALDKFVIYKKYKDDDEEYGEAIEGSTNGSYEIYSFCGTTCFIPLSASSKTSDYVSTDWYLDTYGSIGQ